jgi:hypothetical protein
MTLRSNGDQAAPEYLLDISHAASSSSQASACSVEPGTTEDVSKIVSFLVLMHWLLPSHISHSCAFWDQAELPLR